MSSISILSPRKQKFIRERPSGFEAFEMMQNRGYVYSGPLLGSSLDTYGNSQQNSFLYNNGTILLTFYRLPKNAGTDYSRDVISVVESYNQANVADIHTVVIVLSQGATAKMASQFQDLPIRFEIFDSDKIFNPAADPKSPNISALSSSEASQILKVLEVSPVKLPKIFEESPEIKYRGYRPGTIVRIVNYNASDFSATPRSIDYRLVKKGNFEMK